MSEILNSNIKFDLLQRDHNKELKYFYNLNNKHFERFGKMRTDFRV